LVADGGDESDWDCRDKNNFWERAWGKLPEANDKEGQEEIGEFFKFFDADSLSGVIGKEVEIGVDDFGEIFLESEEGGGFFPLFKIVADLKVLGRIGSKAHVADSDLVVRKLGKRDGGGGLVLEK
jgi:hypothetical protein